MEKKGDKHKYKKIFLIAIIFLVLLIIIHFIAYFYFLEDGSSYLYQIPYGRGSPFDCKTDNECVLVESLGRCEVFEVINKNFVTEYNRKLEERALLKKIFCFGAPILFERYLKAKNDYNINKLEVRCEHEICLLVSDKSNSQRQ